MNILNAVYFPLNLSWIDSLKILQTDSQRARQEAADNICHTMHILIYVSIYMRDGRLEFWNKFQHFQEPK